MSNHNFIVNPIVIGSNTIERVMTYKLLGVYVSNDLKWNHHLEVKVQKGNNFLFDSFFFYTGVISDEKALSLACYSRQGLELIAFVYVDVYQLFRADRLASLLYHRSLLRLTRRH